MPGDKLLLQLERRTEEVMADFASLHISNTLWALARLGLAMGERVMALMERRAEELLRVAATQSDPQVPQYISVHLLYWYLSMLVSQYACFTVCYTALICNDPQANSNDPQIIANILWAYATRGVMPGEKLMGQVSVLVLLY